jgi:Carboxypeptidase regulatory-like domain/TonB dependent receptor
MTLSFVPMRRAAAVCLAMLFIVCTASAQRGTSGSIEGTITDAQGGAISGVKLSAVNSDTGLKLESTSDENGIFHFPVVPTGTYVVTAEHAGFSNYAVRVTVAVGATMTLPIQLNVGSQATSVTVTSEAPIVEVTRSSVQSSVNELAVSDLPTLGRNFINFTLLTPGVTTDVRGGDISFAGQRGTLNSLIVDGSDNNNTFFGQTLGRTGSGRAPYQFSQDAVQEFQVNSNAYSAEYGSAGGAVINVVTKSGTNQFHGTGFEFFRDRGLNATDPIAKAQGRAKQPYHFNQFGGNLGGPVLKDRVFFFFDYDGQRNITQNLILPLSGCIAPPADANIAAACTYLLARDASWTSGFNQDVYLGKVDWHINFNELLSVRINSQRFTGANLENGGSSNSLEHTGASNVTSDTVSGQLTSTLSPRFVNEFRAAYVRDNEPGQANSANPESSVFNGGQLQLTVGRNFFSPRFTNIKRGQFADVLTWIRGRHTFKFGGDILTDRIANFFPGNFSGAYTFNSLEGFGCNLNGGAASTCFTGSDANDTFVEAFGGTGTTGPTTQPNLTEFSGFIQDEWRITPNFTLNPGLRYDYEALAQPSVLNPTAQLAGILTNRINSDKNNFGPRLGFAWTPSRLNQRIVVRGGYGIYYGRTPSILVGTAHSNNGLQVQTLTYRGTSIPFKYPNTQCGPPTATPSCPAPAPGPGVPTPPPPTIFVFNPNYVEPYTQQVSLGVEYQLAKDTALTVSYLGVRGVHLQRTRDVNLAGEVPATIGIAGTSTVLNYLRYPSPTGTPATCPAGLFVVTLTSPCRPNGNFQRIEEVESNANSSYNGLIIQLNKRFGHNYQILGSYTYGKVIDDAPDATSVVPFSGGDDAKMVSDPGNTRADRAAGVNDQRHRFVLSGVWTLNYAQRFSGAAKQILGGWELSGILTAQSGQPYSAMVNTDLNNDSNRSTDRTPGIGRDTFYLPRTVSLDPRITKNIQFTERLRLQLIGEAFNIFNHTNINGVSRTQYAITSCGMAPNTVPCLAAPQVVSSRNFPFQFPTSDITPRIVQLAAKFVF